MKCRDCDAEAKWLITDLSGIDEYFAPYCEEHFQEIVQMEGEMNLDFELIEDLTIEKIIKASNEHNIFWTKRYSNLLKEYSTLKKQLPAKG